MELGANIVRLWFDLRAPSPNSEPAPSVLCGIRSLPLFVAPLKIRWRPGEGTAGRRRPGHGQTEELPAAAARARPRGGMAGGGGSSVDTCEGI
jgi:hypothetical protein